MALWMKHSEKTTQGEGRTSCWTCLNILCIYFQRIKLPYRSKKKRKWEELLAVVWGVRCSCSAQQLLRDSAFSIGYKCVRNPKGVVCVPAGAEGARPFSLSLIGTTCPPEQGGNHSLSVLLGWFSIWGILCCVLGGIEQRHSCGWKFPEQFHLSVGVCAHECITFPIFTFW